MAKSNNTNMMLSMAIVFSAVVIAGALVFFGLQVGKTGTASVSDFDASKFQGMVDNAIDDYVQRSQQGANQPAAPKYVEGDFTDDDPVLGDEDAPVTIVEWSDYECPFCKRFYQTAFQDIKKKYIDTGKAKLVYRDYPLSFHPMAMPAAMAANCLLDQTDVGTYFEFQDKIFMGPELTVEALKGYAEELGADMDEWSSCVDNQEFKDEIEADLAEGQKVGIGGTPGFVINGQVVEGALPFADFEEIIEAALAE